MCPAHSICYHYHHNFLLLSHFRFSHCCLRLDLLVATNSRLPHTFGILHQISDFFDDRNNLFEKATGMRRMLLPATARLVLAVSTFVRSPPVPLGCIKIVTTWIERAVVFLFCLNCWSKPFWASFIGISSFPAVLPFHCTVTFGDGVTLMMIFNIQ